MLMAIQSVQLEGIPLPLGAISICGHIDSSFSFGMDIKQAKWDATVNPHGTILEFKPSPAIPELNLSDAHPFLPGMDVAMHPLASPILCPDEMFKSLPPLLTFMSDGELFYPDFSKAFFTRGLTEVYFTRRALMNGATIQAFLHQKLPHVFPIYDFPEIKTITKSWEEMRLFVKDLEEDNEIVTKAEQVHWDGSKDVIAEEQYITITPDEVGL